MRKFIIKCMNLVLTLFFFIIFFFFGATNDIDLKNYSILWSDFTKYNLTILRSIWKGVRWRKTRASPMKRVERKHVRVNRVSRMSWWHRLRMELASEIRDISDKIHDGNLNKWPSQREARLHNLIIKTNLSLPTDRFGCNFEWTYFGLKFSQSLCESFALLIRLIG